MNTSMTTPTDDQPITRQDHPSWCYGQSCHLDRLPDGSVDGQHEAYRKTVETQYGTPVRIGTAVEHGYERETLCVAVNLACVTDVVPVAVWPDDGRGEAPLELRTKFGQRIWMQPEEARLVARYLLEQADRVESLRHELAVGTPEAVMAEVLDELPTARLETELARRTRADEASCPGRRGSL